jgi:ABC-type transport system substrate-binding protein
VTASLIAGWLKDVGIKVKYQVMDEGIFYDRIWAYDGDTFKPDFDLYIWDWDGYIDPGDTLASFTSSQIESWNEMAWSDAEYDEVVAQQASVIDPEERAPLIWEAQRIFYEQSPMIVLDYSKKIEAVNTSRWEGWVRTQGGEGPAFYTSYNRETYLNVRPKAVGSSTGDGGGGALAAAVTGAVAAVVVIAVVVLVLRRRGRAEEE